MLMPMLRNNWFDDFFGDFPEFDRVAQPVNSNLMKTDIKEMEDGFSIAMDLPGFKKEDVKAHVKDGYLVIQAESNVNNDEKDENGKFLRREPGILSEYLQQFLHNSYISFWVYNKDQISSK